MNTIQKMFRSTIGYKKPLIELAELVKQNIERKGGTVNE